MSLETLKAQAASLPLHPGVYLFKDDAGKVLYVGKAIQLRDRVRSYFAKDIGITRNPGIEKMLLEATTIHHELADSEPEALLLEARLIRRFEPRYNIALRDGKSYLLIKIDTSHPFPVVGVAREKELEELLAKKKRGDAPTTERIRRKIDHVEYFGPFPSGSSVKSVLKVIRQIWPFRDCSPTKYKQFEALGYGCIFASIGLCSAPCAGKISEDEYRQNIVQIRAFLRGEHRSLTETLESEMRKAGDEERYEAARIFRDRLYAIQRFQYVIDSFKIRKNKPADAIVYDKTRDIRIEAYDISNNQGAHAVGSLVCALVRDGKILTLQGADETRKRFSFERARYRKFRIQTVGGISDTEMLQEVLRRRLNRKSQWGLPDLIIIDGGKGQLNAVKAVLADKKALEDVGLASVAKGPTRKRTDRYGDGWERFPEITPESWNLISELLREEAHRFAISYYRSVHRKSLFG